MTDQPGGQLLLYRSEDGRAKLDVRLEHQTVWLSQRQLTDLYGKAKGTISEHIKHIFEDGELTPEAVVRLFRTTAADGKTYEVEHYNLEMVLAVGFRVRSPAGVRFREGETVRASFLASGCRWFGGPAGTRLEWNTLEAACRPTR